jgi:hypothetical protein
MNRTMQAKQNKRIRQNAALPKKQKDFGTAHCWKCKKTGLTVMYRFQLGKARMMTKKPFHPSCFAKYISERC